MEIHFLLGNNIKFTDRNSFSNIITDTFGEGWILKEYDYPLESSIVAIVGSAINEDNKTVQFKYPEFDLSEKQFKDHFQHWMNMIYKTNCQDVIAFGVGHAFDRMIQETKVFKN